MNDTKQGVVVRFGARGFGFIVEPETRTQYFVHVEDVVGRKELHAGDRVVFQAGQQRAGKETRAILVELVSSPDRVDRKGIAHATAKPNHAIVGPCSEELLKAHAVLSGAPEANGVPANGR